MKKWYESKTIWGLIIAVIGMAMKISFPVFTANVIQVCGIGFALIGRLMAEKKIL